MKQQIATTMEQSYKLLELGISSNTADMSWHFTNMKSESLQWELKTNPLVTKENFFGKIEKLASPLHKHTDGSPMTGEEVFDKIWGKDLPAWSLGALIKLLPERISIDESFRIIIRHNDIIYQNYNRVLYVEEGDNMFDNCINMIVWLVRNNILKVK